MCLIYKKDVDEFIITKEIVDGAYGESYYLAQSKHYNVIGAGKTKRSALIEAKGNLKAHLNVLKQLGRDK